jgi:cellulose synthase/poly-beta-1,6-N-acetylglucosamine synthase-like glycosyltransferase
LRKTIFYSSSFGEKFGFYMLIAIIGLLALTYALMMAYFCFGAFKLKDKRRVDLPLKTVSVIVPLHNEEEHAQRTLELLDAQVFQSDWEIICVDDRSTDQTPQILANFCKDNPRFRVITIPLNAPEIPSPKKRALAEGFKHAKMEILMTMDADCRPPAHWMQSMAQNFHGDIAIVQGPKRIFGSNKLIHNFQKLDTLGFTLIEGAGFSLKNPLVASAAALAYKKSVFEAVNGFDGLMEYASGDDDMLVHKMVALNTDYCYNLDAKAQVETAPVDSWVQLLNQRARWSSNGANYDNKFYVAFLVSIYLFICWIFFSPLIVILFSLSWFYFLVPLFVKGIFDFTFLKLGAKKLESEDLLRHFPAVLLIQIPLIVLAVPAGQLKLFKWK